jgi:hypothetical protein
MQKEPSLFGFPGAVERDAKRMYSPKFTFPNFNGGARRR